MPEAFCHVVNARLDIYQPSLRHIVDQPVDAVSHILPASRGTFDHQHIPLLHVRLFLDRIRKQVQIVKPLLIKLDGQVCRVIQHKADASRLHHRHDRL